MKRPEHSASPIEGRPGVKFQTIQKCLSKISLENKPEFGSKYGYVFRRNARKRGSL
jgi:hypothetical protein